MTPSGRSGPHPHTALGGGREFDAVRAMLLRWGPVAVGVGDDCAVLEVPAGELLCVSTDSSVEGVHFRREWLRPDEIGYRAATAALSDLAAMGARPLALLGADNGSLSQLVVSSTAWTLRRFNDTSHLAHDLQVARSALT